MTIIKNWNSTFNVVWWTFKDLSLDTGAIDSTESSESVWAEANVASLSIRTCCCGFAVIEYRNCTFIDVETCSSHVPESLICLIISKIEEYLEEKKINISLCSKLTVSHSQVYDPSLLTQWELAWHAVSGRPHSSISEQSPSTPLPE